MTSAATAAPTAVERSVRRALAWGGGLLVLGLAVVGVGAPAEGGPIALAGLLATIYGIHRFGRLGPDDASHDGAARGAAIDVMWVGGLALLAGVAFVIGGGGGSGAYAVMLGGGLAFAWGSRANRPAQPAPKRAPSSEIATDEEERPRARRKRARRRDAAE